MPYYFLFQKSNFLSSLPILLLSLKLAIGVSVAWELSLLGVFSFYIARGQKIKPLIVIVEHLLIALVVIAITHYVGVWVGSTFG